MAIRLPKVRIGEPRRHGALVAFPLFTRTRRECSYRLAADALGDGTAHVTEIDEEGSIATVAVENTSDARLFFLEGEELCGAKQDRIVNTSILVPARTSVRIPVSCVEHGRWVFRSRRMLASGRHAPTMVRSALKASVGKAVAEDLVPAANQAQIWDSVAHLHDAYAVQSATGAMSAAFEHHDEAIRDYRRHLSYVPGARGLAVAVAHRIVAIDVFDRTSTCRAVWDRLLSGAVFDALAKSEERPTAGPWDVMCLLNTMFHTRWRRARTVGDGEEYRGTVDGEPASLLCCDNVVVHHSIVLA